MRALVVTTVHHPNDPRIRERTVGALLAGFDVRYATREPGPTDRAGLEWVALRGGRVRRWWAAQREMLRRGVDIISVHDPELIPAALIARLLRRRPVVVDVHEDVPGQMRTKEWVARPLRPVLAWLAARLLRLAERWCVITLAEPGYRRLFRSDHPVFPNHPPAGALGALSADEGFVVYVGDVTAVRGALDMIDAVAAMPEPRPLRVVGRVSDGLAARMWERAQALDVELRLVGPLPHRDAMAVVASASAGLSLLHDIPNYRHSLPTKVVEYLAMGVAVVASDLPGTRAAVDGLEAVWLVPSGDTQAAGAALGEAVARRADAAVQAPAIRERFVWPSGEVLSVYREAAGRTA